MINELTISLQVTIIFIIDSYLKIILLSYWRQHSIWHEWKFRQTDAVSVNEASDNRNKPKQRDKSQKQTDGEIWKWMCWETRRCQLTCYNDDNFLILALTLGCLLQAAFWETSHYIVFVLCVFLLITSSQLSHCRLVCSSQLWSDT